MRSKAEEIVLSEMHKITLQVEHLIERSLFIVFTNKIGTSSSSRNWKIVLYQLELFLFHSILVQVFRLFNV
jgi:hypothetical protein